nr:MAG TPA: hypothetical protein [Caudoviricetes sp.]
MFKWLQAISLVTYITAKVVPNNQFKNRLFIHLTFCKWLIIS